MEKGEGCLMTRIIKVEKCRECPHFFPEERSSSTGELWTKPCCSEISTSTIKEIDDPETIPEWCPLSLVSISAEKVLEKVIKWCEEGIDALQERQVDGYTFYGDSEKIDLLKYEIKWLEELRQTKEREP
jgi:hypothetical protein